MARLTNRLFEPIPTNIGHAVLAESRSSPKQGFSKQLTNSMFSAFEIFTWTKHRLDDSSN